MSWYQRRKIAAESAGKRGERLAVKLFAEAMASESRYRWAGRAVGWLARLFGVSGGWWRPPFLKGWTGLRDFPAPARESFRERWRKRH